MEYEKALVKLAEQVKNWADSKFTAIEQENLELKSKLAELENTLEVQEANKANLPSPPSLEETITTLKSDERFMEYLKGDQGVPGERGEDGKSVSVEEVLETIVTSEDFVKALIGEQGPEGLQGIQGEQGEPGLDADPEVVATYLKSDESFIQIVKGEKGDKGEDGYSPSVDEIVEKLASDEVFKAEITGVDGEDGISIKAFEISESGDFAIEMSDGQLVEIGNIRGPEGKSVDPDTIVKMLNESPEFIEAVRGEKGEQGEQGEMFPEDKAVEIIKGLIDSIEVSYSEKLEKVVSDVGQVVEGLYAAQAVANTKAIQLDLAIEQANRNKVQKYVPEQLVKAGSWVEHEGRFYVANRDTDSVPGDSSAYNLVLRGFEFRKAWNPETTYERLDVVISATGSAWVANKNEPQGEPGSTPDWNLLVKRGERGAKGDTGEKGLKGDSGRDGKDGRGVADLMFDEKGVTVVYDDGFVDPISFNMGEVIEKAIWAWQDTFDLPIASFTGTWIATKKYNRGDMVAFGSSYWIAKKSSTGVVPEPPMLAFATAQESMDCWQLFIAFPTFAMEKGGGIDMSSITKAITDASVAVSTGAPQANKLVALNQFGKIDGSMLSLQGNLLYKGKVNPTAAVGAADGSNNYTPSQGDMWIVGTAGSAHASWGISDPLKVGDLLFYNGTEWDAIAAEHDVAALNTQIGSLETRVAALEAKLAAVTGTANSIRVAGTIDATGDITAFKP